MSQESPIPRQEHRSDGAAVLEWGGTESDGPGRIGRTLSGLGRDRRLPVLLAALGAVAALASMLGEWQVMILPNAGPQGNTPLRVPGGVSDVGGFGVGYLAGLFALVCAVVLALRGTLSVRPNARLVGLALAGALLGLLVATAASLDEAGQRVFFYSTDDGFRVEYGRGLVMAFLACVLFATALKLAPARAVPVPEETDDGDEAEPVGQRRRSRRARDVVDDGLPAPADLTVGPAIPFARPEPRD
ncbi:hypothetical protein [Micromonospora peucetia]|uniref:Tryptophan-associated transmembrane protein (Trp_oprn_chp) n=1 Tax=Micromonospora peucetia TaxID=47871 RepID=A0A1C6UY34_9ACTN|nr:hypothetical protein [Micromonospora peucetia]WSA35035.1 hypothetical protein OIE14_13780 [Micromonospora peucetia]SCL58931.1 hypothetical protein GA0070608_2062 [Micromonospora peucetia]